MQQPKPAAAAAVTPPSLDEELARHLAQEEADRFERSTAKETKKLAKKLEKWDQVPAWCTAWLTSQDLAPMTVYSDPSWGASPNAEGLTLTVDAYEDSPAANELDKACQLVAFLDLDNCPGELELLCGGNLPPNAVVYVFGGPHLPKMPAAKLPELADLFRSRRLRLVHTNQSAKNAADFALAFWAGLLHTRIAKHVPFLIISRDRGLRNVLYQLRCFGRYATVVGSGLVEYLKNSEKLTKAVKDTFAELLNEQKAGASPDSPSVPAASGSAVLMPAAAAPVAAKASKSPGILPGGVDVENSAVLVLDKLLKTSAAQRPKNARSLARFVSSVAKIPEELAGLIIDLLVKQNHLLLDQGVHYLF